MRVKIVLTLFLSVVFRLVSAQDSRLANEYFMSGEYEKAAYIYKKLFETGNNNYHYFGRYVDALISMEDFQLAEEEIKKQLERTPNHMQLYVTYGSLFERQFMPEKADKQYRKAIDNIPPDVWVINNLGNAFTQITKYDMAIEAFIKGSELLNNDQLFAYNLADLYRRKGDTKNMITYNLKAIADRPSSLEHYKTVFQRFLTTDDDLDELQLQLYDLIADDPDNEIYPELLEWVFIERKQYDKALRQARALDRKYQEDGSRVMNLGDIAYVGGDYETAIKAYDYVAQNKSINSTLYIEAKRAILKSKRNKITQNYDYKISDLDSLEFEYVSFIDEFGINRMTEYLVKEYADFLAIYKNDLPGAISVLEELINIASINKYIRANSKISLADYYLMQGEIWEATLLYSQVDKSFREEYLGEIARFKNAKLSYYAGNFEWAQAQFDILKAATSKLIANDAIELSVFIMDNMGLDTTDAPLKMFAEAELLTVQNNFDQAFIKLDSINLLFPDHALQDDILYQKANLYYKIKDFDKAIELYRTVYEKFPEEIRADNSLMAAAEINEYYFKNLEEAKSLYEKLFIDFSSSTFAVEARKRYRILRGDNIQ